MIIAACDPGKKGAFVAIDKYGNILYQFAFKSNKDDAFDIKHFSDNVKDFLLKHGNSSIIFVVEDVHSLYHVTAKSNFNFGKNCGIIEASIVTLGYKVNKVTPKVWQKEMLIGIEKIKEKDSNKTDTKAMALKAQEKLFPDFNSLASTRCREPHDGLIDALLIAEYTRREIIKGNIL
jgi:hypothetical protein